MDAEFIKRHVIPVHKGVAAAEVATRLYQLGHAEAARIAHQMAVDYLRSEPKAAPEVPDTARSGAAIPPSLNAADTSPGLACGIDDPEWWPEKMDELYHLRYEDAPGAE